MRRLRLLLIGTFAVLIGGSVNVLQTHCASALNNGNNVSVGIPTCVNDKIAGTTLAFGDEICVSTPSGLFIGADMWRAGSNAWITARGDNDQAPATDGLRSGEQMSKRVGQQSTNAGYANVDATFSVGNGMYILSFLAASPLQPVPPTLLWPANEATGVSTNPTFSWSASGPATSYGLQLSTSSSFSTTVVNTNGILGTSYLVRGLANGTVFYWRVNATDPEGTSPYSSVWSFTTIGREPPPQAPTLTSPANGATGVSTNPTLSWNASSSAASYQLQVSTSSSFSTNVVSQSGIAQTSYPVPSLADNTLYYWHVNATNAWGTSAYSLTWSFRTGLPPIASFEYSPEHPHVDEEVTLDASSSYDPDGTIVNYEWDFGDGNSTAGQVVNHLYSTAGNYTVILTVTDNEGIANTTTSVITVMDIRVTMWTDGGYMNGHTIPELEDWYEGVSAVLTIHVRVTNGDQPVEGAEILFRGVSRGNTDNKGQLSFFFNIDGIPPIMTGQYVSKAEARWNGISVESEPTLIYESKNLVHKPRILSEGEVSTYRWELLQRFYEEFEVPLPYPLNIIQTLIRFLAYWTAEEGYRMQVNDVASIDTYYFTAPNVAPVWLVRETIVRNGAAIIWRNSWTENELKYYQAVNPQFVELLDRNGIGFILASPATLYVTAPDGSHAGYEASSGRLVLEFPIVISEPGDEPFLLFIPQPVEGKYLLSVIGTRTGSYTLFIQSSDSNGVGPQQYGFIVPTTEGRIHEYPITVSRTGHVAVNPELVSPSKNAVSQPVILDLIWNKTIYAESYHLQVSEDSLLESFVVNDSTTIDTTKHVGPLAHNTEYFWRVKAINIGGTSDWSDSWNFRTIVQLPERIILVSPLDDAVLGADSSLFIWQKGQPEIEKYWFELSQDSPFAGSFIDSTTTDTSFAKKGLENKKYWWKVKAWNQAGWGAFSQTRSFKSFITSISEINRFPEEYALDQNYPNPFNPSTTISFSVPFRSFVTLKVYDVLGREVGTLVSEVLSPGVYSRQWEAPRLPSGVYFYLLQAGTFTETKKLVLLR